MLSRDQCRKADQVAIEKFKIPGLILMENAGRNCASKILAKFPAGTIAQQAVLILCGPGNNGGDGFVIARHLYNAGVKVKLVLLSSPMKYSGDALTNLTAVSGLQLSVVEFDSAWTADQAQAVFANVAGIPTTWIVDAMLGTGASGEPRPPIDRAIMMANSMNVRTLAIDIPSGLDCDTGAPASVTFRADLTCTFVDRKIGFDNPAAAEFLGELVVVDIGAPPEILQALRHPEATVDD